MLFLVISTPRPERPSTLVEIRSRYWVWLKPLLDEDAAKEFLASQAQMEVKP